jgi:hypothetical protein
MFPAISCGQSKRFSSAQRQRAGGRCPRQSGNWRFLGYGSISMGTFVTGGELLLIRCVSMNSLYHVPDRVAQLPPIVTDITGSAACASVTSNIPSMIAQSRRLNAGTRASALARSISVLASPGGTYAATDSRRASRAPGAVALWFRAPSAHADLIASTRGVQSVLWPLTCPCP